MLSLCLLIALILSCDVLVVEGEIAGDLTLNNPVFLLAEDC